MFDELIRNMIFDNIIAEADNNLCFTAVNANSTVSLTAVGSPTTSGLQYKVGNGSYSPYTIGTVITCKNIGDKVYFKNTENTLNKGYAQWVYFETSGLFDVSGDLSSMNNYSLVLADWVFCGLFQKTNIRFADQLVLPWVSMSSYCFFMMFSSCKNLISSPNLSATVLSQSCYQNMFENCTSLVNTFPLKATQATANCYLSMFYGCTSLVKAPSIFLATLGAGAGCCSFMFQGCTNLNRIYVSHTIWETTNYLYFSNWVNGVEGQGQFICPADLPIEYGNSRIPTNFTPLQIM